MGDFRVVVEAVGGHGCERQYGDGEHVALGCGQPSCPDCITREYVRRMKRACNGMIKRAEIQHWPADMPGYSEEGQVTDDLLTGLRRGSFPERERYLSRGYLSRA